MTDDERLELVRKESGCHEVYAIPNFPGYFVTKYREVYSFKSKGVGEPGYTPTRMHAYRVNGYLMVRLSRKGMGSHQRNVGTLYECAKYGVDPTVYMPAEIQRLTQELAASRQQNASLLQRLSRLEASQRLAGD